MQPADFRPSIIITSYNARDYLIESVDSVIAQTLRPHEIIIADDGSTDGSRETIRNYEQRHPGWIKGVYQQQNVGIPANRNAALREVTGNFVGILDGDDTFVQDKLERQHQALKSAPGLKVVYSNYRCVEPDGTALNNRYNHPQAQGGVLASVAALNYGILRTMLADTDAVKAAGCMDERFPKLDGLYLTIKLASTCKFSYIHEPLVDKKEYPGSDSRLNTVLERLHDHAGIFCEMQPYLMSLDSNTLQSINILWFHRMGTLINSLERNDLDAACSLLGSLCNNSVNAPVTCLLAAIISSRLELKADARSYYRRAIKVSNDAFTLYQSGCIAMLNGEYGDAIIALQQSLELKPDTVDAHFRLGSSYLATGNTSMARSYFESTVALQPDNTEALNMIRQLTGSI